LCGHGSCYKHSLNKYRIRYFGKTIHAILFDGLVLQSLSFLQNYICFFYSAQTGAIIKRIPAANHVNKWVHTGICAGIVGFIVFPSISTGALNDDKVERPPLHGAYQIAHFIINNDKLNNCDFPYKRFFIHRNNYIIFQKEDETMVDYFFEINAGRKQMDIRDYQNNKITVMYTYDEKAGALQLNFENNAKWVIRSVSLNWKALPALQDALHYTIDEIK
jgi:hypothetical protein